MKRIITFFLILSAINIAWAQTIETETAKKYGLVSYLTTVKALSEYKMLTLAKDSKYKETQNASKVKKFNSQYNLLKLSVDQLINQLSADSYNSNRLKCYSGINNFLKKNKPLSDRYSFYEEIIKQIDGLQETFLMATYSSALAGPSIEEFTGVATLAIETITSYRDFREKKIQSITALLKELKLTSLGDLTETKDKQE